MLLYKLLPYQVSIEPVLISHNVNIFDNDTHTLSVSKRHEQFRAIISGSSTSNIDLYEKEVVIQDDVLIGCMSIILKELPLVKALL
jgi:acetyltransferase-like isoleucine patch superfamily enzyme